MIVKRRTYPLQRAADPLSVSIPLDPITAIAIKPFDLNPAAPVEFYPWKRPRLRPQWSVGLIVGASGSGKSTLLRSFGTPDTPAWGDQAIAAHFETADQAVEHLHAVGLNAVPTWRKPYSVLSNGERFRADLARCLHNGALVDEYSSVVSRPVAQSASAALRRWLDRSGASNLVFASCHYDIIDWLQPDWVIDCSAGTYRFRSRSNTRWWSEQVGPKEGLLHLNEHTVDVWRLTAQVAQVLWKRMFSQHHYLTAALMKATKSFLATWDDEVVGFTSYIRMRGKYGTNSDGSARLAWREHRTVVLPDYQGMGMGMALSDWLAQHVLQAYPRDRFYSRTMHPRMAAYRDASPQWRITGKSRRQRLNWEHHEEYDVRRIAVSHEYVAILS